MSKYTEFLAALREVYARYPDESAQYESDYDALRRECEEQARLVGKGSEREARLIAERDAAQDQRSRLLSVTYDLRKERDRLTDALAERERLIRTIKERK